MKLVLHIVGKDLRRMRRWLMGWAGALILPIFLGVRIASSDPATKEAWAILDDIINYLTALQVFLAYLLTVLLVQEDRLVGSQQFWLTRPLSGWRLGSAKLVGAVVILVIMPLVVMLPWWLWAGFGPPQIIRAMAEYILPVCLLALLGAFVATVVDSFGRVVLWTIALAAFGLTVPALLLYFNRSSEVETTLLITRLLVSALVFFSTVAVAVGVQFFTRRRLWSLGLVGSAAGFSLLTLIAWPWSWVCREDTMEYYPDRTADVKVALGQATVRKDTPRKDAVSVTFPAAGLPADLMLVNLSAQQTWQWEGSILERWSYYNWNSETPALLGLKPMERDAETLRWQQEHPQKYRKQISQPGRPEIVVGSVVPPSFGAKMVAQSPAFRAQLWLETIRPVLRYELELRPGVKKRGAGFTTKVVSVERTPTTDRARIVETAPFFLSNHWRPELSRKTVLTYFGERWYFALNRVRGEFEGVTVDGSSEVVYGVQIGWQTVRLFRKLVRDGLWVERPIWSEPPVLGFFSLEVDSVFSREVSVDRLRVEKIP